MSRKVYILLFVAMFFLACTERDNSESIIYEEANIIETTKIDISTIQKLNIIKFVNAPAGLRIRNSPDINTERIGGLVDLTRVSVIREDDHTVTIDGIDGQWAFIDANGIQGWVFGGFLSSTQPIRTSAKSITNIINYISAHFNLDDLRRHMDNNTLESFLIALGISGEFRIVKRDSFLGPHGSKINSYDIEYGQYNLNIWEIPEISRHRLMWLEIELKESNFLNFFPHRTIEEFMANDSFGERNTYGENFVNYSDIDNNASWTLWFRDGILYKISYVPFLT